jgi:hypothetical protein
MHKVKPDRKPKLPVKKSYPGDHADETKPEPKKRKKRELGVGKKDRLRKHLSDEPVKGDRCRQTPHRTFTTT